MKTNTALRFLGWAALTFGWLETNRLFFKAIIDAINEHNEQIRLKTVDYCFKMIAKEIVEMREDENKNESEDENEDESEDE